MDRASGLNTHTLYAHYARLKESAVAEILRLRKYLFPEEVISAGGSAEENIGRYLVPVVAHRAPLQERINQAMADRAPWAEIDALQLRLENYSNRYDKAVADYRESVPWLNKLRGDNDIFLAPSAKRDKYLYILDKETCAFVAGGADQVCTFRDRFIELSGAQTDAVRVWDDNVVLDNLRIMDQRRYGNDKAHRDAIQLIPPLEYKTLTNNGRERRVKQLDQLACSLLQQVSIRDCHIRAQHGPLQGIFASDGMFRDLKLNGNTVTTKGAHAIAIAGALSGCEFRNNTLRQVSGGSKPAITLYPARIGGNMADDGVLNILSFKADSEFRYGDYIDSDNRLYHQGETTVLKVQDLRRTIPPQSRHFAAGLLNFDFATYRLQYVGWTVRDFQARDPVGYTRLRDWLELRVQEYQSGERQDDRLLPPTAEQRTVVLKLLTEAHMAIVRNTADFRAMRLADLPYTPMRSFMMKRIAVRNAEIAPLEDLGDDNELRRANLAFILPQRALNNLVSAGDLNAGSAVATGDATMSGDATLAEGIV